MTIMEKQKVTLQTVDRALELIDLLADSGEMSVIEISKALSVTRTGAYNLLNSLLARHYVEKNDANNKYYLGYRFLELGTVYRYRYPFVLITQRSVYTLSKKWKYQINLSIYKSPCTLVFILQKASENVQRTPQRVVLPSYATASGKLLMAYLPPEQLAEDMSQVTFERFARQTITDKDVFLKELERIRAQGYSTEVEECVNQRTCIACPVRDMTGKVLGAISMVIPLEDFEANFQKYLDDVQSTADTASMDLGFNPYR